MDKQTRKRNGRRKRHEYAVIAFIAHTVVYEVGEAPACEQLGK